MARPPTGLTLTGPKLIGLVDVGHVADGALAAVLAARGLAALILAGTDGVSRAHLKNLVGLIQRHDCAVLVANDIEIARQIGADGVHLDAGGDLLGRYGAARGLLGPAASIGAEVPLSRHVAMELGEAGADYVAFGMVADEIDPGINADERRARRDDLIRWWAEVIEVPAVALGCDSGAEAARLIDLGADFAGLAIRHLVES